MRIAALIWLGAIALGEVVIPPNTRRKLHAKNDRREIERDRDGILHFSRCLVAAWTALCVVELAGWLP